MPKWNLKKPRLIIILFGMVIIALAAMLVEYSKRPPLQGYVEGEYIYLASNYPGILKELPIFRGNEVKEGQLLFVLDNEPEASQLQQARELLQEEQEKLEDVEKGQRQTILEAIVAQREQAQANLGIDSLTLKRYQALYAKNAIDKESLDKAAATYQHDLNLVEQYKANLEEAKLGAREYAILAQKAAVAHAQAVVNQNQWQLSQKTVYAPTSGRIFDTYYKVGEFVNSQQPVTALLAPKDIKLVFYIPEPQRSELALGKTIYFTCDNCKEKYSGTINYLSPQAEYTPPVIYSRESREKLVYRVEASLPLTTARQVYPGQPVDVYLK